MSEKTAFTFLHPLRVRWGECDPQGIVFNVNYFLYFDVGITEYMRALGYQGDNILEFYTVNANADFRGSAKFDDELEVGARCARLGNKSMTVAMAIFRNEELLTEGALTYVHAERGTQDTSPLPSDFIERVVAFEKTSPERS
ncbi:thioesterase family protein [Hyphococcus flavus]|uniref:Thioesterase family protein n=1 Tax=Hyphococcus flavus TaxID=1866326 RepID=A0AAE9ZCQ4_9PROT|nr:thioesterase family protein [Hyphococcus flavus]WDI32439.1 thioesterase family protein [Hyphococcus flavus]